MTSNLAAAGDSLVQLGDEANPLEQTLKARI